MKKLIIIVPLVLIPLSMKSDTIYNNTKWPVAVWKWDEVSRPERLATISSKGQATLKAAWEAKKMYFVAEPFWDEFDKIVNGMRDPSLKTPVKEDVVQGNIILDDYFLQVNQFNDGRYYIRTYRPKELISVWTMWPGYPSWSAQLNRALSLSTDPKGAQWSLAAGMKPMPMWLEVNPSPNDYLPATYPHSPGMEIVVFSKSQDSSTKPEIVGATEGLHQLWAGKKIDDIVKMFYSK